MRLNAILLSSFLFIVAANTVHAQGTQPPVPAPPPEGNYILDELDWLTVDQETRINAIIHGLDQDGVAEIGVVTLDECGSNKLAFRKSLFDTWGIGHPDDNDGLLILVCWYGGDPSRRSVEQLFGRGWNGTLTSNKTDQIAQKNFIPAFRTGKPGDGLVAMVRSYDRLLRTSRGSNDPFTSVIRFVENLDEGTIFTSVMLIGAAVLLMLNKILPRSIRERIEEWTRSGSDHWSDRGGDGFGGGSSDGGGGSSTRF